MMCVWQNVPAIVPPPTTSYSNSGGTGDRTASITATYTTSNAFSGLASNLVDGDFTAGAAGAVNVNGTSFVDGDLILFTFASLVYIDEFKYYMDRALSSTWGAWKAQYWDGSTYVDLNSFTWPGAQSATQTITGMPSAGTLRLRLLKVGAQAAISRPWFEEVEFKIAAGV